MGKSNTKKREDSSNKNGKTPSVHNGKTPSAYDGKTPSAYDGKTPFVHNGKTPSPYDGKTPSAYDGKTPFVHNGKTPSVYDGKSPSIKDGKNSSVCDGKSPSIKDGKNSSVYDGKSPSIKDGKNSSVCDGKSISKIESKVSFDVDQDCPPGFWDPHIPSNPETLFESKTTEYPIKNLLKSFQERLSLDLSQGGRCIDVRGDGFCGFYAIMWNIFKQYPEISDIKYHLFQEQISPIMKKYGIVEKMPNDIDGDKLCIIMQEYLEKYYPNIKFPSFAIFSLDDTTIKFKHTSESNEYVKNLITIVHNHRHFKALIYPIHKKVKIYNALMIFFTSKK